MTERPPTTLGFDLGVNLAWALVLEGRLLDHGCFYLCETRPEPTARSPGKPCSIRNSSPGRDSRHRVDLPPVLAGLVKKKRAKRTLEQDLRLCEQAAGYVRTLLAEKKPAVVALEKPQVPTWVEDGREVRRKAADTDWLWLLGWYVCREVGVAGAELAVVEAQDGFRALTGSPSGDKRGHVMIANRRFKLKLRAGQNHEADAIGIALAGEAREGHEERLKRIRA